MRALAAFLVLSAVGAAQPNQLTEQERQEGYLLLFNGKNLDGWEGDPALWSVKNGAIVGSTDGHPIQQNTFLIYKQPFSDFILQAEVKLRNHNSGIQFRRQGLHRRHRHSTACRRSDAGGGPQC